MNTDQDDCSGRRYRIIVVPSSDPNAPREWLGYDAKEQRLFKLRELAPPIAGSGRNHAYPVCCQGC